MSRRHLGRAAWRRAVALLIASGALPHVARAQFPTPPGSDIRDVQPATALAAVSVNALVGGATAAVRARAGRRDVSRAFLRGVVGGAVHFAGKAIAARPGDAAPTLGLLVGATGTSMVGNAGAGLAPLAEGFVPIGPLRVRWARHDGTRARVRLGLNVFETAVAAHTALRSDLRVDWRRSAASGAFVLVTEQRAVMVDDRSVLGLALGSTAVISDQAADRRAVVRHEITHVQQAWFVAEAWGRPAERWLLRRVPGGRCIPRWIEPGLLPGAARLLEYHAFGWYGPLSRLGESEAELMEQR